jgi:hypothetical protein
MAVRRLMRRHCNSLDLGTTLTDFKSLLKVLHDPDIPRMFRYCVYCPCRLLCRLCLRSYGARRPMSTHYNVPHFLNGTDLSFQMSSYLRGQTRHMLVLTDSTDHDGNPSGRSELRLFGSVDNYKDKLVIKSDPILHLLFFQFSRTPPLPSTSTQ